jgi:hypothetical protein
MKNAIIIILSLLFFASPAMAETKDLTFAWEQEAADIPIIEKWTLYAQRVTSGPFVKVLDVPYTAGSGAGPTFTASGTFDLIAPPGTAPGVVVKNWFHLTATNKNGKETLPSNEVFVEFANPYPDVTVPIKLNVTVTVKPAAATIKAAPAKSSK